MLASFGLGLTQTATVSTMRPLKQQSSSQSALRSPNTFADDQIAAENFWTAVP